MSPLQALRRAQRLCREALPKFNWGASTLDANAIQLLNEVPAEIDRAVAALEAAPKLKGCPRCFGSGGKRADPCQRCNGTGRIAKDAES